METGPEERGSSGIGGIGGASGIGSGTGGGHSPELGSGVGGGVVSGGSGISDGDKVAILRREYKKLQAQFQALQSENEALLDRVKRSELLAQDRELLAEQVIDANAKVLQLTAESEELRLENKEIMEENERLLGHLKGRSGTQKARAALGDEVPESESNLETFPCSYNSSRGRLLVTPNYVCFGPIFSSKHKLALKFEDIASLEKVKGGKLSIGDGHSVELLTRNDTKHIFKAFFARDAAMRAIVTQGERLGCNIVVKGKPLKTLK